MKGKALAFDSLSTSSCMSLEFVESEIGPQIGEGDRVGGNV